MAVQPKAALQRAVVPTQFKIAALWAAMMFCYVYGDFFGLYSPGTLADMNMGKMGPLGVASDGVLVGVSLLIAIPSLMVFLSLVLPPAINRWANIVLGLIYPIPVLLTVLGSPPFYMMLSGIEIAINLVTVWYAWTWPRGSAVMIRDDG